MSDLTRRKLWSNRAEVPLRLGSVHLKDFRWGERSDRTVETWVQMLLDGRVIGAADSPLCGKGLLLQGTQGTGKTTLACAVLNDLLRDVPTLGEGVFIRPTGYSPRPIFYTRFEDLLRLHKETFSDDPSPRAVSIVKGVAGDADHDYAISVLVIDDLGKEYESEWTKASFESLIRTRYDRGLPTIITTNVPLRDWAEPYGETTASFAHEAFLSVEIMSSVGDRRLRR